MNDETKPVTVSCLEDIKWVIKEFMPKAVESPKVRTKFKDEVGKVYALEAPTDCDYRSMLIQGFEIIKRRIDAAQKVAAARASTGS